MREWVLAAAAILAYPAQASAGHDYKYLGHGSGQFQFLDTETMQSSAGGIEAWLLYVYVPPQKTKSGGIRYGLFRNLYSCGARTVAPVLGIEYSSKGDAIREYGMGTPMPVIPESLGEAALSRVCAPSVGQENPLTSFATIEAAMAFSDFAAKDASKKKP